MTDVTEDFVRRLTEHQNRLYGYVYSLLGNHSRAADVVQETNLVLWRKVHEFDPDKPFAPWAFAIARFQVLAHLRDQGRDRMLLDESLVATISDEVESQAQQIDVLRSALRPCLRALSTRNQELIQQRYFRAMSTRAIASAMDRTVSSVKVALLRVRQNLAQCVERRIAGELNS